MRPRISWLRRWLAVAAILAVLSVSVSSSVLANLAGSPFDAKDGNLLLDDESQDWVNAPNLAVALDLPTGQQDDSFGNGTKEDSAVPSVIDGSIPNNKSDLTRFYVASQRAGAENDQFLYLAWERVQEPSGTTNMDFEFNQSSAPSGNGVTPVRTAGDVLIKYDLSQGGTNPVLGYHLWVTSGNAAQVCEASNSLPCWGKVQSLAGNFEGAINTAVVSDPIAPNAPRSLSVRTFGEAAINLTDSGILPPGTCNGFGSAYLKSRSSDSFTAAVKDFIAPIPVNISNCGTINILKTDDAGATLAGAGFTLYADNAPLGGSRGAEDTATDNTCSTGADGKCSLGNDVPFGKYWVVETTIPSGYEGAADQYADLNATTPDLTLSFTFVNVRQFTVIVLVCQNSDSSLYASTITVDGQEKVSLGPNGGGAISDADLCALGGARYSPKTAGNYSAGVNIPLVGLIP